MPVNKQHILVRQHDITSRVISIVLRVYFLILKSTALTRLTLLFDAIPGFFLKVKIPDFIH